MIADELGTFKTGDHEIEPLELVIVTHSNQGFRVPEANQELPLEEKLEPEINHDPSDTRVGQSVVGGHPRYRCGDCESPLFGNEPACPACGERITSWTE